MKYLGDVLIIDIMINEGYCGAIILEAELIVHFQRNIWWEEQYAERKLHLGLLLFQMLCLKLTAKLNQF